MDMTHQRYFLKRSSKNSLSAMTEDWSRAVVEIKRPQMVKRVAVTVP